MSDPFIGEIRVVGFNYAPMGWALCNGQILQIAQYSALFSLLGTTYGGDGTRTFGLPDLQGRVPVNVGQGAGLPVYNWGDKGGAASVAVPVPQHTHTATFTGTAPGGSANLAMAVQGSSAVGGTTAPAGNYLAGAPHASSSGLYVANPATTTLGNIAGVSGSLSGLPTPAGTVAVATAGTPSASLATEPPYLAMYYIIALVGIWPSRE